MDKYQEMRVFAAVVEASSFVAAADSLGMSKAAVSRHVAELEQRLGVRLMHRTTRKLSLTPEGEVFLARCRDILSSIEASEAEISTHSVTVGGLLKLSVPVSFGIRHLAPLWHEFLALHPQVSLDVQLADRVIDLIDEGFDLAIRIARLPDSTLISRQIASTRLVLCAAPGYLRRRGAPKHPSIWPATSGTGRDRGIPRVARELCAAARGAAAIWTRAPRAGTAATRTAGTAMSGSGWSNFSPILVSECWLLNSDLLLSGGPTSRRVTPIRPSCR